MTLKHIIETITKSSISDWNNISCWGFGAGPSYKNNFTFYEALNGSSNVLTSDSHSELSVFKNDITISMAYGLTANEDFVTPWPGLFPSDEASSHFIDIFYNNGLVFRDTFLTIDGGRCKLPIPSYGENGDLVVKREYYEFIKFLELLSSGTDSIENFEYYFNRTKVTIIDETWI